MSEDSFAGWSLEDWSLQHELLELRFILWPDVKTEAELEAYNQANKNTCYRGKGIFTQPTRMAFSNFASPAKVKSVTITRCTDDVFAYRFVLEKDAFVEIEAKAYASARW